MISILHPVFILGNDRISSVQAESLNTRETVSCENCQMNLPSFTEFFGDISYDFSKPATRFQQP